MNQSVNNSKSPGAMSRGFLSMEWVDGFGSRYFYLVADF